MKLTIRDVISTVFRYSRALLVFWAVVLLSALIFYSQSQKLYESKAKILVSLGTEAQGKAEYLNEKNMQLLQREQQIHNEQQILESHEVALTVAKWILGEPTSIPIPAELGSGIKQARRFFSGEEPAPTLLAGLGRMLNGLFGGKEAPDEQRENTALALSVGLTVKPILDSDALDVTFRYRDPQVAQTVLKLLIAAYLDHHIAVFQSNAEATLLKAQLDHSLNNYHDRLGDLSKFMNDHRVYNDDSQVNSLIEQRARLGTALQEAQADNDVTTARLAALKPIEDSLHQLEHYSTTEVRNKQREALMAKLADAEVEERTLLTKHPLGSRAYEDQQAKMEELRRLVNQEPMQVVQETEQRKSKASEFVESEVISLTAMQQGYAAKVSRLRGDVQKLDYEIQNYATDLKGFDALKLDLNFAKQESEQMAKVYMDSRLKNLTSQSAITDVSIVDPPTWDPHPASPRKRIVMAATILLLALGSLALLLACASLDTTVADNTTAELGLGLPVAATLPFLRGEETERNFPEYFTRENQQEYAKLYQSLRGTGPEGKLILFGQSRPQEGASLVGYGLARFLSHYAKEKTVFIDRTEHPLTASLSFSGADGDDPVILAWPTVEEGETGKLRTDAVEFLSKLRQEYTFVVVSAGAVKDAADLLTISGMVSTAFFIVEADKTRRPAARYNLELLRRYGFQGVQLILNKRIFYIPSWLMRFV